MSEQTHIQPIYSESLKTKGQTYFFDVREAKNGKKYLMITASRIKEGEKLRSTITVFPDNLQEFGKTVAKMQEKVK